MAPKSLRGFTLIELSIVLVIIGLIVGGVLAGRELLISAELRKVISEVQSYKTAFLAFRTKYNQLPGDLSDATQIWGTDTACPYQPARLTPATVTCNGNGNGMVGDSDDPFWSYETWRAWQHLSNAQLIGGSYSGTSVIGISQGSTKLPGTNIPAIFRGRQGISAEYLRSSGYTPPVNVRHQNVLHIYGPTNWTNGAGIAPPFTASDMLYIDTKTDDGHPINGKVVSGVYDQNAGCFTNAGMIGLPYAYDLTQTTYSCTPTFSAGF